jgi:hypothetical protein
MVGNEGLGFLVLFFEQGGFFQSIVNPGAQVCGPGFGR